MNKPISTWTQTFFQLGYTLRRIWRDEPDYANNYTPLALEVLEDRQMLSGFGGDDPMGGGTGGTGGGSNTDGGAGGSIIGGGGYTGPTAGIGGPATNAGSGFNDYNHLTLSAHWLYGVSGDYAWNHTSSLLDYTTRHTNEDTSGVFYRATTNESDKDLGTYFVTFATYNWNVIVSASSSSSGPQGGSTSGGTGAWYREELSVSVTGFTIETTNSNIAAYWQATGSFGDFNIANYTQVATIVPNSNASYSYHATIDPNDYYSAVDVDVAENLDVTKDYDTSLDWLLDREGYTDQNRVISGHLTISGSTAYTKQTAFNATRAQDVWTFDLVGSEASYFQETYTYVDARLVTTTVGYVPVEIAHHTSAPRRPKLDSQGNPLPEPPEGKRFIWEKDGTIAYESDSTLEFQGSGAYSYLGDQWIRTGDVYSTFYDNSSYENNYESTIQTDETMVGATILTETNGEDISLSALRFSIGSYESDNESGDGSMELSLSYVHKSLMPDRNTVTTTSGRQSVFHYIPNGSFTETISAVPFENLEPGEVARVSTVVEQTHRQFLTTKLWEDDPAGGHGRITTTRLTSDSIDGEPNLISSENSSITLSDFMIHVDPSLIPQPTNNQGDGGTSTSGGQSSSGGSSGQSQNSGDSIFEQLGQLFENIRERLEKRSAANPGVNTTGTSIERSEQSFTFSEYWTREVASVYVSPETWIIANESFNGSVVGATYESASSERTTSIEKSAEESVTFLSGTAFVLNNYETIEDNSVTWNDHVADRYTHTVGTLLPVGVFNQPFLPTPSGTLIPQPLIPIVIEQYIGQMHYTSLSGTMTWNSNAGISEPYEHDPDDPGLIRYVVTRSLEADAHGEADTHGTNATLAGFTSWRTTFEETNDGFASEKRSVEATSETDQTLVEKTSYQSLRANPGDPDSVSSLRQLVTVVRPIADNYYIPTGQSSLPLVTVELQSTNNPHFYSLDAFDNQDVLRNVKEFAGIFPGADSNATGQHFTSGSYTPPAEEAPEEGQASQAAPTAVWKSISKFVDIEFSVQNAMSFMQGFAQGFFVEGAWGTITGLYDLVAYAGNGLYNMAEYVGTHVFFGADAASETTMGQTIDSAMKAVMEHSKVFVQLVADLPTLLGMSDRALSAETQGVLDAASDILQKIIPEILQELSELPEAERARIIGVVTGFITFEVALQVASAVFTGGVGNVLSAAAKAGKFCKWARKLATLIPAKHRRPILDLIKKYVGCFEAETNVASYSIQGNLAAVALAARASLEVQPEDRPSLTDGQWAAIGLGLVVALSCSGLQRKSKSDQESDDDPWQVQYHYAA